MSSMTLRLKRRTFGWRALTQVKAEGKVTDDDGLSGKRNSAQRAPSAKVIYFWIPFWHISSSNDPFSNEIKYLHKQD